MSKICILLATHWGKLQGGAEIQAHYLADHITHHSAHDVEYLGRWVPEQTDDFDYPIHAYTPPPGFASLKWGQTLDSFSMYRQLRRINPDVILQIAAGAITGLGALYAANHDIPLVWWVASDKDLDPKPSVGRSPVTVLDRWAFKYGIRRADQIIVQSQAQDALLQQNYGRDADLIIPNFHPTPTHLPERDKPVRVTWVANVKPLKRPECFVQLAERMAAIEDLEFVMVGRADADAEGQHVRDADQRLPNFRYVGEQTMEEVNDWLAKSHFFVNTSEYEGFPNTFVQAWMRAVPTLTLGVDPDKVISTHGLGACCGSVDEMQKTIQALINDQSSYQAMCDAAKEFAETHFSMRRADELIELLASASAHAPVPA